jgi:hypothetical protein
MTTHEAPSIHPIRDLPSLAPGLLILGAGVVLLLSRMDIIALEDLWKLWPAGLILAGLAELEKWWKEQR